MVTISVSGDACAEIEATFPEEWRTETSPDGKGGYLHTLPDGVIGLLKAIRRPGKSYSDVMLRLASSI